MFFDARTNTKNKHDSHDTSSFCLSLLCFLKALKDAYVRLFRSLFMCSRASFQRLERRDLTSGTACNIELFFCPSVRGGFANSVRGNSNRRRDNTFSWRCLHSLTRNLLRPARTLSCNSLKISTALFLTRVISSRAPATMREFHTEPQSAMNE